ncbi:helix-turn-helix domain-containing protein [Arachidicoccus terrestris]|uniref:helix-turn-helix domain-containing protein n=1 Tax=Arachidicoccus terrestris TaxID=2875539 RepID=UPI001CC57A19|nr:AraC family transcriptional regulator [Arachidicoccus terrestris]UAY56020.1 AraC family transcriptional regulator [Arachidicoccus terrestris]
MDNSFFDIKSSKNDTHYWNNIPYKKGKNGIFLPESGVISLHSGWSDMHFHFFDRAKYTLYINLYDVRDSRETRVQSAGSTVEYTMMLTNQVYNHLGGLQPAEIPQGAFNITYLPFVDSLVRFKKGQFYCTLDIHLKDVFLNELMIDFPSVMEPLLNAMEHKTPKRVFDLHAPCTLFMTDLARSILHYLNSGPAYLPVVDKNVEGLIAHAVAYKMGTYSSSLDDKRTLLMHEIYYKAIENLSKFPGIDELAQFAQTNPTTLHREFKEMFNITIKQHWIAYRLDKALQMVVHERDKRISEIALILGYTCLANFNRAFKAKYKHPPGFFRNGQSDIDSIRLDDQ